MELRFWWLGLLLIAAVAGWFIYLKFRPSKTKKSTDSRKPLANFWRLMRLPEYRDALNSYAKLVKIALALTALVVIGAVVTASRPTSVTVVELEMRNRDIMLCLDVSGSMYEANKRITNIYSEMVKDFEGERIGLTVFDNSPVMLFPLTTDYEFASDYLKKVSNIFNQKDYNQKTDEELNMASEIFAGTRLGGGSSLIGDGLAGCVGRFDNLKTERSRSVIFATDNYLAGSPIVTLEEAGQLTEENTIRIYSINPSDHSYGSFVSKEAEALKKVTLSTGGDYYKMDDPTAVEKIIQKISEQEATRFKGSPQIVYSDRPEIFLAIVTISFTLMIIIAWRLKL